MVRVRPSRGPGIRCKSDNRQEPTAPSANYLTQRGGTSRQQIPRGKRRRFSPTGGGVLASEADGEAPGRDPFGTDALSSCKGRMSQGAARCTSSMPLPGATGWRSRPRGHGMRSERVGDHPAHGDNGPAGSGPSASQLLVAHDPHASAESDHDSGHDLHHAATAQPSSLTSPTEPARAGAERVGRHRSRRWPIQQPAAWCRIRGCTRVDPAGRR
jgi:hypothetical protein